MNQLLKAVSRQNPCYNSYPSYGLINSIRNVHLTRAQYLYSPSALGVESYLQTRKRVKEQFCQFSENFRIKMTEFVQNPKHMIFTEDLKNMIHIAEPSDISLVLDMIKKFNTQNTEFRFGSFVFGPVVMRMFYFHDAPVEALKCFEDPANAGFFDQLVTYQILMDLLYNHEMYDEIYQVFQKVQERQINMTRFPKYPVVLVLAACYKQNTPESYAYAKKLWKELTNVGTVPLRRACTFMAGMALKHGEPHIALECITLQAPHYVTIRNIKVIALSKIDRIDDALPILRGVLDVDTPHKTDKHTFFEETIKAVREAVNNCSNNDIVTEFNNVEKALRDRDLIDTQTLDKLLNSEIVLAVKNRTLPRGMPRMAFGQRQKTRT